MSNERLLELCIAIGAFIILIALNKILAIGMAIAISLYFILKYKLYLHWRSFLILFLHFIFAHPNKKQ